MKKILLILTFFLITQSNIFSQISYQIPITLKNGNITNVHKLGVSPNNTFGIDTALSLGIYREVPAPPPPPPPFNFDSRFVTIPGHPTTFPIGLAGGVMNDFRKYYDNNQIDSFKIKIDGDGTDNNPTIVSWQNDLHKYAESWIIKPQTGTSWPETNMLTTNSLEIPAGGNKNLIIIKVGVRNPTNIVSENNIPNKYYLEQNFPNPFNPSTKIKFGISKTSKVVLEVFNLLGQKVKTLVNETLKQGSYEVEFNAQNLNSGIYFYSIKTEDFSYSRKMVLQK